MIDHEAIGKIMCQNGYGVGVTPNPFANQCKEWERRKTNKATRQLLTDKIESLFEPRFITPPETSEAIESLVTMTESLHVLELGMHTGFTSLHILRALVGKPGAKLVSVDARPALDRAFFARNEFQPYFEFLEGWTPQCLDSLKGRNFDLVFIDSDHTVEHCEKERVALMEITKPGCIWLFHDVPKWATPDNRNQPPVSDWLDALVRDRFLAGYSFQTAEQLDCLINYGPGYPKECNPHLGIFVRL